MRGNEFRHPFQDVLRFFGGLSRTFGRRSAGCLSGTGCISCRSACGFSCFGSRIFLLDRLLLTPAGEGIGCRIPRSFSCSLRSLRSRIGRFDADIIIAVLVDLGTDLSFRKLCGTAGSRFLFRIAFLLFGRRPFTAFSPSGSNTAFSNRIFSPAAFWAVVSL